jgi:hypothetical protein
MTTLDRLDGWKASGVISAEQHLLLRALVRQDRFSLFVEINALLYLGVLSLVTGLFNTFRDFVVNLGDAVILGILTLLMGAAFAWCFSKANPYAHEEVESPSVVFDYILYFGCLMLSSTLGFVETRFGLFGDWTAHLFLASIVFGLFAYRFDNRFVLSLAISTLAGFLGLRMGLFDTTDTDALRLTALLFGGTLCGLGVWLARQGVKAHFLDLYLHIGANLALVAMASGVLEPATGLAYFAALLALAGLAIYLGTRFDRFAFVAYGTLYGYAGLSARLLQTIGGFTLALWYFAITGTLVVIGLTVLARRFGRDE